LKHATPTAVIFVTGCALRAGGGSGTNYISRMQFGIPITSVEKAKFTQLLVKVRRQFIQTAQDVRRGNGPWQELRAFPD
jgi:hypothetical protein